MSVMSKYLLARVVLPLSVNKFVETTPNSCYGKDCRAATAVFTRTNSNSFHFVILALIRNQIRAKQIKMHACCIQQNALRLKKHFNLWLKHNDYKFAKFQDRV